MAPVKTVALMKVRNEEWVLGCSLPAALLAADEVVILDHASTDRTPAIIERTAELYAGRIHRLTHDDPEWTEAAIQQRMLDAGREAGGTHFLIIDADEVITGNILFALRNWLHALRPGQGLATPWIAMWNSLDHYRDDESVWGRNFNLLGFRDGPNIRYAGDDDGYDLHTRWPRGLEGENFCRLTSPHEGGVMHLQFANRRRLVAKHAWYKMTETVRFPGRKPAEEIDALYNQALDETGLQRTHAGRDWWAPYRSLIREINMEVAPWHEEACREMWAEHGAETFDRLELWGVPQGKVGAPARPAQPARTATTPPATAHAGPRSVARPDAALPRVGVFCTTKAGDDLDFMLRSIALNTEHPDFTVLVGADPGLQRDDPTPRLEEHKRDYPWFDYVFDADRPEERLGSGSASDMLEDLYQRLLARGCERFFFVNDDISVTRWWLHFAEDAIQRFDGCGLVLPHDGLARLMGCEGRFSGFQYFSREYVERFHPWGTAFRTDPMRCFFVDLEMCVRAAHHERLAYEPRCGVMHLHHTYLPGTVTVDRPFNHLRMDQAADGRMFIEQMRAEGIDPWRWLPNLDAFAPASLHEALESLRREPATV
jgi:glycosyltransferase involved in cell wall biosynthesis